MQRRERPHRLGQPSMQPDSLRRHQHNSKADSTKHSISIHGKRNAAQVLLGPGGWLLSRRVVRVAVPAEHTVPLRDGHLLPQQHSAVTARSTMARPAGTRADSPAGAPC